MQEKLIFNVCQQKIDECENLHVWDKHFELHIYITSYRITASIVGVTQIEMNEISSAQLALSRLEKVWQFMQHNYNQGIVPINTDSFLTLLTNFSPFASDIKFKK